MATFVLYLVGTLVLIGGLIYAAWLVHVPTAWIAAGAIVVLGLGILGAARNLGRRDG